MSVGIRFTPINRGKLSERFKKMARQLPASVDDALRTAADDMRADFQETTATWDHAVSFDVDKLPKGYGVKTDDDIWNMLNAGTPPHEIMPKDPDGVLAFQSEYQAKTRAAWIGSKEGGPSGDAVFARAVQHPGTQARRWSKTIYDKWQDKVTKYVRDALRAGVEATGR